MGPLFSLLSVESVTLFGNTVIAGVIEVRIHREHPAYRMDPKSNDLNSCKKKRGHRVTHREERHVKTQAEIGIMLPRNARNLLDLEKASKDSSLELLERVWPC